MKNKPAIEHINALSHGIAIYDNRHLEFGSHHQKILVVKGSAGLIAFCGGIDINSDRLLKTEKGPGAGEMGAPLHDVHCRIQGPAAYDLLKIFVERWQDYTQNVGDNQEPISLLGASEGEPIATDKAYYIQVGRTYGNISTHRGIDSAPNEKQGGTPKGYSFAPRGEQTARRMILHAISQAQEFIYMEDQYLVSLEVSRALQDALPKLKHLTILIPHGSISDMPQIHYRRREFIAPLKAVGGSKVRVFYLNPPGDEHTYVHSKVYVIDDEFAILGSANCNRRSLTHDSEVAIGIYDEYETDFARAMRIKLWAEHLNLNKADVVDGIKSASYWINPPPGARIAPYDENADIELLHTDTAWDTVEDPDGG